MKKKRFVEAASSTLHIIIYRNVTSNIRTNCTNLQDITNDKEVNAVENVSTYAHISIKLTSCWLIFNNWSYVDSLGLHACKRVAWRTGMNLFLWCGLVLFRLDETTHICVHSDIYIHIQNTGHNEVISFDLLWNKCMLYISWCITYIYIITKLSDWSCRWLSFILKIKPCMSKYELV